MHQAYIRGKVHACNHWNAWPSFSHPSMKWSLCHHLWHVAHKWSLIFPGEALLCIALADRLTKRKDHADAVLNSKFASQGSCDAGGANVPECISLQWDTRSMLAKQETFCRHSNLLWAKIKNKIKSIRPQSNQNASLAFYDNIIHCMQIMAHIECHYSYQTIPLDLHFMSFVVCWFVGWLVFPLKILNGSNFPPFFRVKLPPFHRRFLNCCFRRK